MRELVNKKVLVLVIGIHTFFFLFLIGLIFSDYYSNKYNMLNEAYKRDLNIINQEINFLSKQADIIYALIINDRVKRILELKDKRVARKLLYSELKDEYEKIKGFFNILHFQMKCYSFLRFYDENRYGDFLGNFRKSVCYVLTNKKIFRGFEVGKYGVFYRNVYPVKDDITVEISVDFYEILKSLFKNSYIVLDKSCTNVDVSKFAYDIDGRYCSYRSKFLEKADFSKKIWKDFFIYKVGNGIYIVIKENNYAIKELKNYYLKLILIVVFLYVVIALFIVLIYKYLIKRSEATYDALTSLLNRKGCIVEIEKIGEYSLLVVDIDFFKKINDTYGHDVGDEILKGVGNILKSSLRKTDIVCRWGGEEFLIILPYTELKNAVKVAEMLRKKVKESSFKEGIKVTISIGVSQYVGSFEATFKIADENLYKAKRGGRDRVEFR